MSQVCEHTLVRQRGAPVRHVLEVAHSRGGDDRVGDQLGLVGQADLELVTAAGTARASVASRSHRCDVALVDYDTLLALEPAGVVKEHGDRDRVDLGRPHPLFLEKSLERVDLRGVEVPIGPERRYMPSGMLSVQKPRGRPTTIVSMPFSIALAAVAIPYGPAPITTNMDRPPFTSDSRPSRAESTLAHE